jgi:hypothetical protein
VEISLNPNVVKPSISFSIPSGVMQANASARRTTEQLWARGVAV